MPSASQESSPLTFDLKEELLAKIEAARSSLDMATNSEVIRHAIETFDFGSYSAPVKAHRQISVRLRMDSKQRLVKLAKKLKKEKVQMDIIFLRPSQGEHEGARAHQRDAQREVSIVFSQCFIHNPYLVLVFPLFL